MFLYLSVILISCKLAFAYELLPIYVSDEKDSIEETHHISTLKTHQAMDLASVLEQVPGISVSRSGGGQQASIHLRGGPAGHTLIILDGVILNDPSSVNQSFDASSLVVGGIKSVKVLKGDAYALYGAGAIAGVIELETYKGERGRSVSVLAGRNQGAAISHSFAGEQSLVQLNLQSYQYRGESAASSGKENDNKHTFDSKVSYLRDIDESFSFEGAIGFYQSVTDEDSLDAWGVPVDSKENKSFYTRYLSMMMLRKKLTAGDLIYRVSRQDLLRESRFDSQVQKFKSSHIQHHLQFDLHTHQSWSGSIGADWHYENVSIYPEMDSEMRIYEAYFLGKKILAKSESTKTSIQSGARVTSSSLYADHFSPLLTLELGYKRKHLWTLTYSQAVKSPSLYQLYGPDFDNFKIGNKALSPEKSDSLDLSYDYLNRLKLGIFQRSTEDYIQFVNALGYQNTSAHTVRGVEFSLSLEREHYSFNPSMTWMEFVDERSTPVLRRSKKSMNLSFRYRVQDDLQMNIKYIWKGTSYDLVRGDYRELSEQESLSLYVDRRFRNMSWKFGAENIFRQNTVSSYGYSGSPVAYFAGLTYFY